MNAVDFPAESTVIGRLSLSSFVKLFMIAALGVLPVFGLLTLMALGIGVVRSVRPLTVQDLPPDAFMWFMLLVQVGGFIVSTLLTGAFFGVAGYPLYSWLCRRRGGIVLRGRFWGRS